MNDNEVRIYYFTGSLDNNLVQLYDLSGSLDTIKKLDL